MKSRLGIAFALGIALAGFGLAVSVARAGTAEVQLKLPIRPKLLLKGKEKIAVAPFVIAANEKKQGGRLAIEIDVEQEFKRFLIKQITQNTKLTVVPVLGVKLGSADLRVNEKDQTFWRKVGNDSGADLVVSGSIDFDIEDKTGYKTEEYVSPVDGRTYYRQVLVEQTGFLFDILLQVFDGKTGEKIYEEAFQDFREHESQNYDQLLGMFENLHALEDRILGIFSPQEAEVTRFIFTD